MINKILVFGGIAILAILIIENMVITNTAYVLWFISKSYILSILSTFAGIAIGFGIRGSIGLEDKNDIENDF